MSLVVVAVVAIGGGAAWIATGSRGDAAAVRPTVTATPSASATPSPSVSPSPSRPAVSAPAAGDHTLTVQVQGRARTLILRVPPAAQTGRPLPLALVFHGSGDSAAEAEADTNLAPAADSDGFLVAYMQGYEASWNDHNGHTKAQTAGVDDVAFTAAALTAIERLVPVDTTRVTAVGFSNGALFVNLLGCSLADRLTALVMAEGQLSTTVAASCHPSRPLSVVQVNGTADPTIPYAGGDTTLSGAVVPMLSASDAASRWAQFNGCTGAPTDSSPASDIRLKTYAPCRDGVTVQLRTVDGGGHDWPDDVAGLVTGTFR